MNILIILQLAVTLLINASTNQAITVEQKQEALTFAVQAVQLANTYLVENTLSNTSSSDIYTPVNPVAIPLPESISQPSAQSSTRVENVHLGISENSEQGSLFGKLYTVEAQGDNIVLDAVVVAIKDIADREKFYPNSGVLVEKKDKGVVARLGAKECSAVKPSYACPGKEIKTAEQRQALLEIGYHNKDTFTLIQGESYLLEIPESARVVYVSGKGERSGQVIEIEL